MKKMGHPVTRMPHSAFQVAGRGTRKRQSYWQFENFAELICVLQSKVSVTM